MKLQILDFKCPSLNASYSGRHWTKRRAEASYIHTLVAIDCRRQAITPITEFPIDVTVTAYYKDNRRRDSGNISNKELIDGLVIAGIIPDDNTKYIRAVTTIAVNKAGSNYVEIECNSVTK